MVGSVQGTSHEVPNGNGWLTRRRYLLLGAALTAVSGCAGDDDDGTGDDDDGAGDGSDVDADDSGHDSDDGAGTELDVREDFDSFILEMTTTYQGPEGDWTQQLYREVDVANERVYQQFEMTGDEGEPAVFEKYIVDGEGYQILPDGTCGATGEEAIMAHGDNLGDFERPPPEEVDEDAEHLTHTGTATVPWVDESVDVWEFDLEATSQVIDGVMEMYIGRESGYIVGYEGWYTTGAHDNPTEITFTERRHSFNLDFEIEIPDECTSQ